MFAYFRIIFIFAALVLLSFVFANKDELLEPNEPASSLPELETRVSAMSDALQVCQYGIESNLDYKTKIPDIEAEQNEQEWQFIWMGSISTTDKDDEKTMLSASCHVSKVTGKITRLSVGGTQVI